MTLSHGAQLEALAIVTGHFAKLLGAIGEDQWASPTPCDEWDVRTLVDHVVGGNWFTIAVLSGVTSTEAIVEARDRFKGGSATAQQAITSGEAQLSAFRATNVLARQWHHVAGELTGDEILRLRLHDLIVHAWDIDQGIHSSTALPEALVRWGLAELASEESSAVRHFGVSTSTTSGVDSPHVTYLSSFDRRVDHDQGSTTSHSLG